MTFRCPLCERPMKTVDSRPQQIAELRYVTRRVECRHCSTRYSTYEFFHQDLIDRSDFFNALG